MINTLYLAIIIKTYIPFSSGPIKSEDHILPAQCLSHDSWVTLRSDLRVFNDGPPLISWWRKKHSHYWKGWPSKAQEDVCFRPLAICHPYHAAFTLQKWLPLVAMAIPHMLRDARGNNESSRRRLIPCITSRFQLCETSKACNFSFLKCFLSDGGLWWLLPLSCFGHNPLVPAWEAVYIISKKIIWLV